MRELTINERRVETGLNLTLLAQAIGATKAEVSALDGVAVPSEDLVQKVEAVAAEYRAWRDGVVAQVNTAGRVTSSQLSRLLHMSSFSIYQMIHRGILTPSTTDRRPPDRLHRSVDQHWWDGRTVAQLFAQNSTELIGVQDRRRTGLLGRAFAAYLQEKKQTAKVSASAY